MLSSGAKYSIDDVLGCVAELKACFCTPQPNLQRRLLWWHRLPREIGSGWNICGMRRCDPCALPHINKICRGLPRIVRAPIFRTRDRRGPTARWRRSRLVPRYQRHRASGPHLRVCGRSALQQMDRPATVAARRYGRNKYDPALRHSALTHWLLSRAGDSIAARGRTLAAAPAGFRGQGGHVGGVHADVFALCDAQPRNE